MAQTSNEQVYQDVLAGYKQAIVNDHTLSFAAFCRSYPIEIARAQHWLSRHNICISDIRSKILQENGYIVSLPIKKCTSAIYEATWHQYIDTIKTKNLAMALFCKLRDVPCRGMQKWMERNNLTVIDARIAAGLEKETPVITQNDFDMSEFKSRRLSGLLDKYKRLIKKEPTYSLRAFCKENNTSYHEMANWMNNLGVTVTQLKRAVAIGGYIPRQPKKVFIQFTPNGGSNSDRLRGVKIQMPDGNNILVQECTVLSLCSFIHQYNNDLKRGKNNV